MLTKKGKVDDSKGKVVMLPLDAKKAKSNRTTSKGITRLIAPREGTSASLGNALWPRNSMIASAFMAKKILAGVILPADRERFEKLSSDQVVTKFLYIIGQIFIYFYPSLSFLYSY